MVCRLIITLGIAFGLLLGSATGMTANEVSQAEAKSRLQQLKTEISRLKRELEQSRSKLSREQKALKAADLDIQANVLQSRELESERQVHVQKLSVLEAERQDYLHNLRDRNDALAEQIMAAYRLGRQSRLKLILNQDSPALLSRTLAYYDYFSRSQASQISELKQVLLALDQMQEKINAELSMLKEVQKSQQAILDEMTIQRNERQDIIDVLSNQIGSDEARLTQLHQDRKDLETLLERLSDVLSDIPADLGKRLAPADLKGKMSMPVSGRVRHAYGQARTAGMRWQGWLIAADNGSEVRAIAHGRVAYSDWLRGYGLLMIIDHGDGFMSLYANNESLLHEVGDWVEPGTLISTVGSSPRNGTGLYFEIRKNGKALDPAVWLKR